MYLFDCAVMCNKLWMLLKLIIQVSARNSIIGCLKYSLVSYFHFFIIIPSRNLHILHFSIYLFFCVFAAYLYIWIVINFYFLLYVWCPIWTMQHMTADEFVFVDQFVVIEYLKYAELLLWLLAHILIGLQLIGINEYFLNTHQSRHSLQLTAFFSFISASGIHPHIKLKHKEQQKNTYINNCSEQKIARCRL